MEGDTPQEKPLPLTDKDRAFMAAMSGEMRRMDRVAKRLAKAIGVAEEDGPRLVQLMFSNPDLI